MLRQSEGEAPNGASCGRAVPHTQPSAGQALRDGPRHPRHPDRDRGTAGHGDLGQCVGSVAAGVEAETAVLPWGI